MSFTRLKQEDLYRIATEEFGVEVDQSAKKDVIIAAMVENGVTWDMAKKFDKTVAAEDVVVQAEKEVLAEELKANEPKALLRMMRENASFEVRGYKFTKAHPIGIVSESDAEYITENIDGFRYATPKEAQEFYS